MKVWIFLSLLLLAAPVFADTDYWIDPVNGNNNNAGTQGAPWRTIEKFNTSAVQANTTNGHVILHILPNGLPTDMYVNFPNPPLAPANGKRYFIQGNVANPALTRIVGGTLSTPYTSITGVKLEGGVTIDSTAKRCSLLVATVNGTLGIHGNYSVAATVTVTGDLRIGRPLSGGICNTAGCPVAGCPASLCNKRTRTVGVVLNTITAINGGNGFFQIGANNLNPHSEYTDSVTVKNCTFAATLNGTDNKGFGAFNSTNLKLERNHWKFTVNTTSGTPNICYTVRDSADGFVAQADTVQTIGNLASIFFGQNGEHSSGGATSMTLDSSYFHAKLIGFYAMGNISASYSTFVGDDINGDDEIRGANLFDHCAFIGGQRSSRSVFRLDGQLIGGSGPGKPVNIKNSIFYGTTFPHEVKFCDLRSSCLYFGGNNTDSLTLNRNLYANFDYDGTPGDKALVVNNGCEDPGPGGSISPDTSFFGSPQFARGTADSVPTFTEFTIFDTNLGRRSRAIGNGFALSDIGPRDYVPVPSLLITSGEAKELHDVALGQAVNYIVRVYNAGTDSLVIPTLTCVDANGTIVTDLAVDVVANVRLDAGQTKQLVCTFTAPSSGAWGHPVTRYLSLNNTNDPLLTIRRVPVFINPEGGSGGVDPLVVD